MTLGIRLDSPLENEPVLDAKRQKMEGFDPIPLFFQIIASAEEAHGPLIDIAESLLFDHTLSFNLAQIEDFEIFENQLYLYMNDEPASIQRRCNKLLLLLYVMALKNSPFFDEFHQAEQDCVQLSPLADETVLKAKHRRIRTASKDEQRGILAEIQSLRPYLDKARNKKILLLARTLSIHFEEEIRPNFIDQFEDFTKRVKGVKEWILGAHEFNPKLFVNNAPPMSLAPSYSSMEAFWDYSLPFCEALGSIFLEKGGRMGGFAEANAIWDGLFQEEVEWMDLAQLLVSQMTPNEAETLLNGLKEAPQEFQPHVCRDHLDPLLKRFQLSTLEEIKSFLTASHQVV